MSNKKLGQFDYYLNALYLYWAKSKYLNQLNIIIVGFSTIFQTSIIFNGVWSQQSNHRLHLCWISMYL